MSMIDTAMGALRATVAKALGLNGRLSECSREGLTFADNASATMVAGRRSPVAGRRSPVAGRRSPVAGRSSCVRITGRFSPAHLPPDASAAGRLSESGQPTSLSDNFDSAPARHPAGSGTMIGSALNCLSRFCCTCEGDGARVRELMRVSAWLGLRSRMSVWVIAVFGIAMIAVAGTAAAQTPRLDVFDENVMEGDAITFKILLSAESIQPVTVQYATESGTDRQWESVNAQSGSDFTGASGTLTFAPGCGFLRT